MNERIRVGISACLLGQAVRFDGGHKKDETLTEMLGPHVEFVPVCPEVEMGLGIPREPMRLVRLGSGLRMVTVESAVDHTEPLRRWAAGRLDQLAREGLAGYILKADSPSCGLSQVKTFASDGAPLEPNGRGLFAEMLTERFPCLPVTDERRLADPTVREGFVRQVLDYHERSLAPIRSASVIRVGEKGASEVTDSTAVEEPLEIRLHDRPFIVTMRTPGADRELAAGFLLSEGIVRSGAELGAVERCRSPDHPGTHNLVNVFLLGEPRTRLEALLAERRNVVANSSCGICGRVTIDSLQTRAVPLEVTIRLDRAVVQTLPDALRSRQSLFDQTGGLHGAALFTTGGAFVAMAEDVGRHNAVDKVIGAMLLEERVPLRGHALAVSGRTSFEIVQKAWVAGIEIICAVSAPTSLAIDLAVEAGITLVGFVRDRGFNIYSHPRRVIL
jgi:FdhD protein